MEAEFYESGMVINVKLDVDALVEQVSDQVILDEFQNRDLEKKLPDDTLARLMEENPKLVAQVVEELEPDDLIPYLADGKLVIGVPDDRDPVQMPTEDLVGIVIGRIGYGGLAGHLGPDEMVNRLRALGRGMPPAIRTYVAWTHAQFHHGEESSCTQPVCAWARTAA